MMKVRVQQSVGCGGGVFCGGYTMIEMMVIVSMFGIITSLLLVGYPLLRTREKFIGAEQQIQSVVRIAQQMAIQEDRDELCLTEVEGLGLLDPGDAKECVRRCSDIGVAFDGSEIVTFADLDGSGKWEAPGAGGECGGDFELNRQGLPEGVTASSDNAFVFLGVPPTVTLNIDEVEVESGQVTVSVGDDTLDLTVYRYGHVSRD